MGGALTSTRRLQSNMEGDTGEGKVWRVVQLGVVGERTSGEESTVWG